MTNSAKALVCFGIFAAALICHLSSLLPAPPIGIKQVWVLHPLSLAPLFLLLMELNRQYRSYQRTRAEIAAEVLRTLPWWVIVGVVLLVLYIPLRFFQMGGVGEALYGPREVRELRAFSLFWMLFSLVPGIFFLYLPRLRR